MSPDKAYTCQPKLDWLKIKQSLTDLWKIAQNVIRGTMLSSGEELKLMTSQITVLPIEKIVPSAAQPRKEFDQASLQRLADTIKAHGLLSPIHVRKLPEKNQYQIIAGERRWRAVQLAGIREIPCFIVDYNDAKTAKVALIENTARENLNPIEEAQSFASILTEAKCTQEQLAKELGIDRTRIASLLRLLKLDVRVQQLIKDKQLSEGHGKVLASWDCSEQYSLAVETLKGGWSVRKLEKVMRSRLAHHKRLIPNAKLNPDITALEHKISDYLGTAIEIRPRKQQSGELIIKYANYDVLDGILERIGYSKED